MQLTPEQALQNLTTIADAALLNKDQRNAIEQSVMILNAMVKATPATDAPADDALTDN